MITTYAQATFYLFWSGRVLASPLRTLFPWRGMGRLLLLTAVAALPLPWIATFPGASLFRLAVAAVLYFPAVALLLWRWGPYGAEDREAIRRLALPGTELANAYVGTLRLKLLKVGAKLADIVEVELATNKPIRLGFRLPYSAILDYYVAPRVEAE